MAKLCQRAQYDGLSFVALNEAADLQQDAHYERPIKDSHQHRARSLARRPDQVCSKLFGGQPLDE